MPVLVWLLVRIEVHHRTEPLYAGRKIIVLANLSGMRKQAFRLNTFFRLCVSSYTPPYTIVAFSTV